MRIPQISPNRLAKLESGARSFVAGMTKSGVLAPIILLELFVTGGRTYQAYKRGGFVEARERATEETLGAICWLGGVKMFNKLGDNLGKKLLKLKVADFDTGVDATRKPLGNYLKSFPELGKKALAGFKATKIISSILLANTFVGIIVPKVNQAITRKYEKNLSHNLKPYAAMFTPTMDEFKERAKPLSFKGNGIDRIFSLAHLFENDAKYQLLSTDAGVLTGRTLSARNNDERMEIAFRDFSSIYFYMFAKNHINTMLNKIQTGKATRLDPVSAKQVDLQLSKLFGGKRSAFGSDEFLKYALGNQNAKIPDTLTFTKDGIIKLDEFLSKIDKKYLQERAKKMAKLQPATSEGLILTKNQVLDVLKGGLINEPEFLNSVQTQVTSGKSVNPYKYVKQKDMEGLKADIVNYVEDVVKRAKKLETGKVDVKGVTEDLLKKACKNNFVKSALNLGSGLVVSAIFLSTVIPKVQYWITKQRTGCNEFPGVKHGHGHKVK